MTEFTLIVMAVHLGFRGEPRVGRSCETREARRVWDRRGSAEQILEDLGDQLVFRRDASSVF